MNSVENTEVRSPKDESTQGGRDINEQHSTAMKAIGGFDSFTEIVDDLP